MLLSPTYTRPQKKTLPEVLLSTSPRGFTLTWWGGLLHQRMETKKIHNTPTCLPTPDLTTQNSPRTSPPQLEHRLNLHKLHYQHKFQRVTQYQHQLQPLLHSNANINSILDSITNFNHHFPSNLLASTLTQPNTY
jgi:hypothetical protein